MLLYLNDYCFEISVSLSLVHKLRKAIKGITFILFSSFFIFYILPFQREMTKNTLHNELISTYVQKLAGHGEMSSIFMFMHMLFFANSVNTFII